MESQREQQTQLIYRLIIIKSFPPSPTFSLPQLPSPHFHALHPSHRLHLLFSYLNHFLVYTSSFTHPSSPSFTLPQNPPPHSSLSASPSSFFFSTSSSLTLPQLLPNPSHQPILLYPSHHPPLPFPYINKNKIWENSYVKTKDFSLNFKEKLPTKRDEKYSNLVV